jgi:hypothetical protein
MYGIYGTLGTPYIPYSVRPYMVVIQDEIHLSIEPYTYYTELTLLHTGIVVSGIGGGYGDTEYGK